VNSARRQIDQPKEQGRKGDNNYAEKKRKKTNLLLM